MPAPKSFITCGASFQESFTAPLAACTPSESTTTSNFNPLNSFVVSFDNVTLSNKFAVCPSGLTIPL